MRTLLVPWLFAGLTAAAQQWTPLPAFPGTARDDAAAFTIGTTIYVGTGREVGWGLTNNWWRYDVIDQSWAPVAPLPAAPRQYAVGFSLNGHGYLFGGLDDALELNELWMYDPATDTWTERTPLPGPGRRSAVAFTHAGLAYIVAGQLGDDEPTAECWRYDPASDTWMPRAPLPGAARQRAAAFGLPLPVVVGGSNVDHDPLTDAFRYHPDLDTWTAIAPLPVARFWHRAAAGVVVGGSSSTSQEHADTWAYDPLTDSWLPAPYPDFAGGPRRGAVLEHVDQPGISALFMGLGLGGGERHNDWWQLSIDVGVASTEDSRLTVYPNPAMDHITVQWPGERPMSMDVRDALGRLVATAPPAASGRMAVGHLPPGRYLLCVRSSSGTVLHVPFNKLP